METWRWVICMVSALLLGVAASGVRAQDGPPERLATIRAYADAFRFFNSALAEEDAREMAVILGEEATRHLVDARLVVAVLEVDGVLDSARRGKKELLLGGKPAPEVIAALVRELSDRVRAEKKAGKADDLAIRRALEEHARRRRNAPRGERPFEQADRYVKLYRQLCGHPAE